MSSIDNLTWGATSSVPVIEPADNSWGVGQWILHILIIGFLFDWIFGSSSTTQDYQGRVSASSSDSSPKGLSQRLISLMKRQDNSSRMMEANIDDLDRQWGRPMNTSITYEGEDILHSADSMNQLNAALESWATGHENPADLIKFAKWGITSNQFRSPDVYDNERLLKGELTVAAAMSQNNEFNINATKVELLKDHSVRTTFQYKDGDQTKTFTQSHIFNRLYPTFVDIRVPRNF